MKVVYFATLRDIAGRKDEEWTRPEPTVGALIGELIGRYGREFARWVLDEQGTLGLSIVLVNGRDVRGLQKLETPLAPGDTVTLFPPVGGG